MDRIPADYAYQPQAGKLREDQVAQRSTWSRVPDAQVELAAAHVIHVLPLGASTVTLLNPLDPGTVADPATGQDRPGWLMRPGADGSLHRANTP